MTKMRTASGIEMKIPQPEFFSEVRGIVMYSPPGRPN